MRSMAKLFAAGLLTASVVIPSTAGATTPYGDHPSPIARGPHVSGVVRYQPNSSVAPAAAPAASCSTPGGSNFRTDCNSSGRPVNETWVTYGNGTFYAGANDYNSYNGQGQNGFYWSTDGVNWNDAGPIDVFPHNTNNGAGDPGLAVDANGVVYYSSLMFNYNRCDVGGLELMRRDTNGSWSYYQIAANSRSQFQDKPAIALSGSNVFVSWTQFGSCTGANVTSPIEVAVLPQGGASVAPTTILSVPGSTYSQGSSIASDGAGGFWIAWEEWPSATATNGAIKLAHWNGSWNTPEIISGGGFEDLPSPLSGFSFRTNSFPALTVTGSSPAVAWTSYDTGVGRTYLWQGSTATMIANSGGHQFMPAIVPDGSGSVYVSYSQANSGAGTYDQWLWHAGTASKVSTASSDPSQDRFFSGQFIGDYNGMVFDGTSAHPIWTDIRGADPNYSGWEMDSMIFGTAFLAAPSAPQNLTATPGDQSVALSWSAPASDGGSAVTDYDVYRDGSLLTTVPATTTSLTDTGLTNGQAYSYEVTAINSVGEGPAAGPVSATPAVVSAPSAPQDLSAVTARGRGVELSWTAPASDGGSSVTGYNVYRDGSLLASLGVVTSYKDTHTNRGQTYEYTVTAVNAVGEGAAAGPVSATAK